MPATAQPVRFIFWGGVNTIAAYALYLILFWSFSVLMPSQTAYMSGFVISLIATIILGYFLHCNYTFHASPWNLRQFQKFVSLYIGTTVLNVLLLPVMVEYFGISPELSQGILYLVLPVVSYLGHKSFTFNQRSNR